MGYLLLDHDSFLDFTKVIWQIACHNQRIEEKFYITN
jgi:hypothetical protein